ncbi:MAG: class II aldolase/adducin family protein [Treponema sp.]|jgi:hypothetical protein|nr:class II aldolase/adducin family protein [Treponema sp.]
MNNDGSVKYTARHIPAPPFKFRGWQELNRIRTGLYDMRLIGAYPDGIGFGNISIRINKNEFLISGTATGAKRVLSLQDYCLVTSIDIAANTVDSRGPVQASSESMTHGAIYESCRDIRCVIHIHSRLIFDGMIRDRCPSTPQDVLYGTPEMAYAVIRCAQGGQEGVIVLSGHDEGVLSYSANPGRSFNFIKELYNKYIL